MDIHNFAAVEGAQRYSLTLAGKARLCNQFIHPLQGNREEIWKGFRTPFSKICNSREQFSHAWRSFHFDENSVAIDAYIHRIIQGLPSLIVVKHKFDKCLQTLCPYICIGQYSN